ncbi:VacJ family lipoprotein [Desulfobacterales bacterium HSG17]|nr:VacJ family lipoprotein [Desulfobacterales bacterium HSG17]
MKKKQIVIICTVIILGFLFYPVPGFSASEEDDEYAELMEELEDEEDTAPSIQIADPLYYWNKAIFHFNDKLYFWVMKPVATGYKTITPNPVRSGIKNFFNNLGTPVRVVNCLLQGKAEAAGTELGRFMVNTTFGVLGFGDLSGYEPALKQPPDEDLGQTLGAYGIGNGFYIVLPFLGPSTLRDSIGTVADSFLSPGTYVEPMSASVGITAFDKINSLSFRLGDYETLKEAALEPYESLRNAYIQHRSQKITK